MAISAQASLAYRHLYDQLVDDTAFFWVIRCQALNEPHYLVSDLRDHERRMQASINALLTAPDVAWECCCEAMQFEEGGEAFVASILAFSSGAVDKVKQVAEYAVLNDETHKGVCSALAWLNNEYSVAWLKKFLLSSNADHRFLGVRTCSALRCKPLTTLDQIFSDIHFQVHAPLLARCLRIVGEMKLVNYVSRIAVFHSDDRPPVQFWAVWSSVMLGNVDHVDALLPFVRNESEESRAALQLYCRAAGLKKGRDLITGLAKDGETRLAIEASAALGDPEVVPWLLRQMHERKFARAAAEAFCQITGIDLAKDELAIERADAEANGEDDSFDDDQYLVWPDAERLASKWKQMQPHFDTGNRYFLGEKVHAANFDTTIQLGSARVRRAAALESALRTNQEILVNVEASLAL